jgi:methenyltetrahydromethanopterin cyclohydrolase
MISLNGRAFKVVQRMIADAEALGLAVVRTAGGATVLDAGVQAAGSLEAGRLFAEVCMGGLGEVSFCELGFHGVSLPGVSVTVSQPPLACMAAQLAGWLVEGGDAAHPYRAMGSGPARALRRTEAVFEQLGYHDAAEVAVLALEVGRLPPEAVLEHVAEQCHLPPDHLYVLVASVASLAGSVQVAARVVEAGMHKMSAVGFDIGTVVAASGTCPLAPVAADEPQAMGRANDAVLYGGRAWYWARTDDAAIEAVLEQLPSSASSDYGTPFFDLLHRYSFDFYRMDPMLFSIGELTINNLASGRTFRAGQVDAALVQRTLLG